MVIRAISGWLFAPASGSSGFYLAKENNCSGPITNFFKSPVAGTTEQVAISLGAGATVASGKILHVLSTNSSMRIYLHGFLVPAGSVPASGTAEAALSEGPPGPPPSPPR